MNSEHWNNFADDSLITYILRHSHLANEMFLVEGDLE